MKKPAMSNNRSVLSRTFLSLKRASSADLLLSHYHHHHEQRLWEPSFCTPISQKYFFRSTTIDVSNDDGSSSINTNNNKNTCRINHTTVCCAQQPTSTTLTNPSPPNPSATLVHVPLWTLLDRADIAVTQGSPRLLQKILTLRSVCDLYFNSSGVGEDRSPSCDSTPTPSSSSLDTVQSTAASAIEEQRNELANIKARIQHLFVLSLAQLCVTGSSKSRAKYFEVLFEMGLAEKPPTIIQTSNDSNESNESPNTKNSSSNNDEFNDANNSYSYNSSSSRRKCVSPADSSLYRSCLFPWFYPSKENPTNLFTADKFEKFTRRIATEASLALATTRASPPAGGGHTSTHITSLSDHYSSSRIEDGGTISDTTLQKTDNDFTDHDVDNDKNNVASFLDAACASIIRYFGIERILVVNSDRRDASDGTLLGNGTNTKSEIGLRPISTATDISGGALVKDSRDRLIPPVYTLNGVGHFLSLVLSSEYRQTPERGRQRLSQQKLPVLATTPLGIPTTTKTTPMHHPHSCDSGDAGGIHNSEQGHVSSHYSLVWKGVGNVRLQTSRIRIHSSYSSYPFREMREINNADIKNGKAFFSSSSNNVVDGGSSNAKEAGNSIIDLWENGATAVQKYYNRRLTDCPPFNRSTLASSVSSSGSFKMVRTHSELVDCIVQMMRAQRQMWRQSSSRHRSCSQTHSKKRLNSLTRASGNQVRRGPPSIFKKWKLASFLSKHHREKKPLRRRENKPLSFSRPFPVFIDAEYSQCRFPLEISLLQISFNAMSPKAKERTSDRIGNGARVDVEDMGRSGGGSIKRPNPYVPTADESSNKDLTFVREKDGKCVKTRFERKNDTPRAETKVFIIDLQALMWKEEHREKLEKIRSRQAESQENLHHSSANIVQSERSTKSSKRKGARRKDFPPLLLTPRTRNIRACEVIHRLILNNPNIMTVMHGSSNDVGLFKARLGAHPLLLMIPPPATATREQKSLSKLPTDTPPSSSSSSSTSHHSLAMNTFFDTGIAEHKIHLLIWGHIREYFAPHFNEATTANSLCGGNAITTGVGRDQSSTGTKSEESKNCKIHVLCSGEAPPSVPPSEPPPRKDCPSSSPTAVIPNVLHITHVSPHQPPPHAFTYGVGLATLLKRYNCQGEKDASQQTQDWSLRPLPPEALKYAADDVRYLPHIFTSQLRLLIGGGIPFVNQIAVKSDLDENNPLSCTVVIKCVMEAFEIIFPSLSLKVTANEKEPKRRRAPATFSPSPTTTAAAVDSTDTLPFSVAKRVDLGRFRPQGDVQSQEAIAKRIVRSMSEWFDDKSNRSKEKQVEHGRKEEIEKGEQKEKRIAEVLSIFFASPKDPWVAALYEETTGVKVPQNSNHRQHNQVNEMSFDHGSAKSTSTRKHVNSDHTNQNKKNNFERYHAVTHHQSSKREPKKQTLSLTEFGKSIGVSLGKLQLNILDLTVHLLHSHQNRDHRAATTEENSIANQRSVLNDVLSKSSLLWSPRELAQNTEKFIQKRQNCDEDSWRQPRGDEEEEEREEHENSSTIHLKHIVESSTMYRTQNAQVTLEHYCGLMEVLKAKEKSRARKAKLTRRQRGACLREEKKGLLQEGITNSVDESESNGPIISSSASLDIFGIKFTVTNRSPDVAVTPKTEQPVGAKTKNGTNNVRAKNNKEATVDCPSQRGISSDAIEDDRNNSVEPPATGVAVDTDSHPLSEKIEANRDDTIEVLPIVSDANSSSLSPPRRELPSPARGPPPTGRQVIISFVADHTSIPLIPTNQQAALTSSNCTNTSNGMKNGEQQLGTTSREHLGCSATRACTNNRCKCLGTRWPERRVARLLSLRGLPHPTEVIAKAGDKTRASGHIVLETSHLSLLTTHPLFLVLLARAVHFFVLSFCASINIPPPTKEVPRYVKNNSSFGHLRLHSRGDELLDRHLVRSASIVHADILDLTKRIYDTILDNLCALTLSSCISRKSSLEEEKGRNQIEQTDHQLFTIDDARCILLMEETALASRRSLAFENTCTLKVPVCRIAQIMRGQHTSSKTDAPPSKKNETGSSNISDETKMNFEKISREYSRRGKEGSAVKRIQEEFLVGMLFSAVNGSLIVSNDMLVESSQLIDQGFIRDSRY